jgi:hypothetical protein
VAVFMCLVTKSVHIDLVSTPTSDAFVAALRRFTVCRGKCLHIYKDNGTNFINAYHKLQELWKLFMSKQFNKDLEQFAATE